MRGEETQARREGAIEELVRDPASRRRFLKSAGGLGVAGALTMFVAACGSNENDTKANVATSNDLGIVNFALTLEYLERQYYTEVVDANILRGREQELAKRIRENESEHVKALEAAARNLDGEPVAAPKTDFSSVLSGGRGKVLRTAATLEGTGAGAYLGQARFIDSKEVLASALSIHTVEGRHAAVLNRIVGRPFAPSGAFAEPLSKETVMRDIKPFLV